MTRTTEVPLQLRRDGLDPAAALGRARDGEGVARVMTPWGMPGYLVCRYEDVRRVLSDPARFTSVPTRPPGRAANNGLAEEERARLRAGNLLLHDPPEHTRLRKLLTPEFTGRRLRRLEPRIADIVRSALDDLQRAGPPADLVRHFAFPVPLLVICELLGIPHADRADFQRRSARLLDVSLPRAEHVAVHQENRDYMAGLVARARTAPGEDLLGMLIREHGGDLSTDELVGILVLLMFAGHETTSSMLGLGTLALLRHPDQLAMLRDDPARAEPAVEELLRWLSVVHSTGRTATTEVEIAGHTIPAGSLVLVSIPAANRDRSCRADPDRLDIGRGGPGHVAFGHGPHHCLGAPLARLEMRIAFPALLRRFPGLSLAEPYEHLAFRPFSTVHGVERLPVTW